MLEMRLFDGFYVIRDAVPSAVHIGKSKIYEFNLVIFAKIKKMIDVFYEFSHFPLLCLLIS